MIAGASSSHARKDCHFELNQHSTLKTTGRKTRPSTGQIYPPVEELLAVEQWRTLRRESIVDSLHTVTRKRANERSV